jgi:ATPase/histidine kinase/DNA gyrase B/HSP90 domain protein
MSTQKYIQVEAIVAKYENLASETETVKKTLSAFTDFFIPADFQRLSYVEQLVGYVYQLSAGRQANEHVVKEYKEYARYYISGLISETEEAFLVDNFDILLDYAFEHLNVIATLGLDFAEPKEWSSLVPYLLENKKGRIFIPNSNNGREFVGLDQCDLVVASGFANAAMRAYASGQNIEQYKDSKSKEGLWSDLADGMFDAVLVELSSFSNISIEDTFAACNRIVKNGGEILFCMSKKNVLSEDTTFLHQYIKEQKTLQEIIQLPSGNILFHFVKMSHDTIVMCDATALTQKANEKAIDVTAFQKEIEMSGMPEREKNTIIRRFSYDSLNADILLPSYYLSLPKSGTLIGEITETITASIISDECQKEDHVVTINHLSNVFSKGRFNVDGLPLLKTDRIRRYYRVNGPAVIIAVSNKEIAIGYTTDVTTFLVPKNLFVLKPTAQVDVRFLASQMLSRSVKDQMVRLVYDSGHNATLTNSWRDLVRLEIPNIEQQQKQVQDIAFKDFALQEQYVEMRENGFRHSIRLRKHALSQNISAFDSLFSSLLYCMQEHNGRLNSKDRLSSVSTMTVGEAMEIMRLRLRTICNRVANLSDEQDWGKCEIIEPQMFIEEYERTHHDSKFKFEHLWEEFETNSFTKDVFDKKTGKLLFHKGESMNAAWFPKKALQQVFDNIVANACAHGFTDSARKDYVIQTSWTTDGLSLLIEIANNGTPMPSGINSDLIMEYGYSSALNQKGHGGIGGGEIAEIMRKYGGEVKILSTPEKNFTVTYVLKMPLASLY